MYPKIIQEQTLSDRYHRFCGVKYMKHKLSLVIVLLVVLLVLTPAEDQTTAATHSPNTNLGFPETPSVVYQLEKWSIFLQVSSRWCDETTNPTPCVATTLPLHTVYLDSYYIDRLDTGRFCRSSAWF